MLVLKPQSACANVTSNGVEKPLIADIDPCGERSPQPENAKLSTRYMKRSARTIATTTVTIPSLTGRSCAFVTFAGLSAT